MLWNSTRRIGGICLLVALAFVHGHYARAVSLSWDPSPDAATGNIAGYRLYYSAQSFASLPADVATNPAFTILDVGNATTALITNLPAGQRYYFGVTAYTANGVESFASNVLPYDDSAPTVALTSPVPNGSVLTTDAVTVSATASSSSSLIVKVEFFDGVALIASKTAAPYVFTQTFPAGLHVLTARATDGNNNATTSSAVSIPVIPPPNTPPAVVLTAPSNNSTWLLNNSITISASATDVDGAIAKVDFYDGATLLGSATAAPYAIAISTLAAGSHSITAKATDNLGASTTSSPVVIAVNANQTPTVVLGSPANNSTFLTNDLVTINASASDPDGTIAKVEFYDGATLLGSAAAPPYSFATTTFAAGTHSLTAKATDNLGASATSAAVTITIGVNQAPTVTISSPTKNSSFFDSDNITITANAGDSDGLISKVDFLDGTTRLGTATAPPYSISVSGLAAGTHTLKAKATDNGGASTTSRGVSITVKANIAPTVALTSPAANSVFSTNTPVTIAATASDSDGTIARVDFFDGASLLGTVTSAPYSLLTSSLPAGTHTLTAQATDDHGLSTSASPVTITIVAKSLPTVAWIGLTDGARLSQPVVLTATASDSGGSITQVEFFAGTTSLGVATTPPYTISAALGSGPYTFLAKATDNNGSVGISPAISANVKPTGPHSLTVK